MKGNRIRKEIKSVSFPIHPSSFDSRISKFQQQFIVMALIKEFSTVAEMFLGVTDHFAKSDKDAYRRKVDGKWTGTSYAELYSQVESMALALRSLGLSHGDRVGIMSENRLEWVITDFACVCSGVRIDVPIFPILTPKQVEYVFNNAEVKAVFCSNKLQLNKLLKVIENIPTVQHIIVMQQDAIDAVHATSPRELTSFASLLAKGAKLAAAVTGQLRQLAAQVREEDVATLIYTSGTTGNPKGVMLSHKNFASNLAGVSRRLLISENDLVLSYLPLCHSYERTAGYYTCFACGATTAFADSIETVAKDLIEVRPTLMTSVPRLFERIKGRIEKNVDAGPERKRDIFYRAVEVGRQHYRAVSTKGRAGLFLGAKYALADRIVFSKLRDRIGVTRIRLFASGGGPLPSDVAEFFFAIGLTIVEGYGLTETTPVLTVNPLIGRRSARLARRWTTLRSRSPRMGRSLLAGRTLCLATTSNPAATAETIRLRRLAAHGRYRGVRFGWISEDHRSQEEPLRLLWRKEHCAAADREPVGRESADRSGATHRRRTTVYHRADCSRLRDVEGDRPGTGYTCRRYRRCGRATAIDRP